MRHHEADALLHHRGHGGIMQSRKLANNTYLERHDDGSIAVRLHATDIIVLHPPTDDSELVTLDTGGWLTATTKDRLHTYAPGVAVESSQGVWQVVIRETAMVCDDCRAQQGHDHRPYCGDWREPGTEPTYSLGTAWHLGVVYPFADGFTYDLVSGLATDETMEKVYAVQRANARDRETLRRIKGYVDGFTQPQVLADVARAMLDGDLSGDCWHCSMVNEDGVTMGDMSDPAGHLLSHIDEGYYVPSLAWNVVRERGYGNPGAVMAMMLRDWADGRAGRTDMFAHDLSDYLKRRLLEGSHVKRSPGHLTPTGYFGLRS